MDLKEKANIAKAIITMLERTKCHLSTSKCSKKDISDFFLSSDFISHKSNVFVIHIFIAFVTII